MGENLSELLKLALSDEKVKQMLINTRSEGDPMDAFCNAANSLGFEISLADLVWGGEEYCAAMLRSVNGGGGIVSQHPVFDNECGRRGFAVSRKDRVVTDA